MISFGLSPQDAIQLQLQWLVDVWSLSSLFLSLDYLHDVFQFVPVFITCDHLLLLLDSRKTIIR